MNGYNTLGKILFISCVSIHLSRSMDLIILPFFGITSAVFFSFSTLRLKRPSAGLVFILLVIGGLIGNLTLDDFAPVDSWVVEIKVVAGAFIALFLSLIWVYASRKNRSPSPFDPDTQTMLLLGILLLLLTPVSSDRLFSIAGRKNFSLIQAGGLIISVFVLFSGLKAAILFKRLGLLFCILFIIPVTQKVLSISIAPLNSFFHFILPHARSEARVGFSPSQRLHPYLLLRPSKRPVMRVQAPYLDSPYLIGGKFDFLDTDSMTWIKKEKEEQIIEAEENSLTKRKNNYLFNNHYVPGFIKKDTPLIITSLRLDNYLFLPPRTIRVSGPINSLEWDNTGVLKASFKLKEKKRVAIAGDNTSTPTAQLQSHLTLPKFWDDRLNKKSLTLKGVDRLDTVLKVKRFFKAREYSLRVSLNPKKPFHDFFLNNKPGFCFWFATSAAIVLRANGIPTRLISGYTIHEKIADNLWLVRDRDAHAWVEWQDKKGFWNTMDPTPSSINGYFNEYQKDLMSTWYHVASAKWDEFIQKMLEDSQNELILIALSFALLGWLFVREYKRIDKNSLARSFSKKEWNNVWLKFLSASKLPNNPSWTVKTYKENLPALWTKDKKQLAHSFFYMYIKTRFGKGDILPDNTVKDLIKKIKGMK